MERSLRGGCASAPRARGPRATRSANAAPPGARLVAHAQQGEEGAKASFLTGKPVEDDKTWLGETTPEARLKQRAYLADAEDKVKAFFELAGFRGGRGVRVEWGVLQRPVGKVTTTPDEQTRLRAEAAASITNIGTEERERRGKAGAVVLALTAALALYLSASGAPAFVRFAGVYFPLSLGLGFTASARTGL